jgi:hypothetical protein
MNRTRALKNGRLEGKTDALRLKETSFKTFIVLLDPMVLLHAENPNSGIGIEKKELKGVKRLYSEHQKSLSKKSFWGPLWSDF